MGSNTVLGIILTFTVANAQVEEHGNIPGIRLNASILETCDITVKLEDAGISGLLRDQWVCLAEALSERNTSKLTRMSRNTDPCSQYALGIFQIPNGWCFTEGREEFNKCTRNGCAIDCLKLLDNDITDDVNCIKFIHDMRGFDPWDQTKVAQCNRGVMNNQWNQTECIIDRRRRGGTRTISTISLWAAILLVALTSLLVFSLTYFFYKYRRNSHNVLSNQEIKEFKYGRIRGIPSMIQPRISLYHEDFTTAPYNNDYEISPAEFVIDHNVRLGSGAFGVVYKATCKGKVVAAKTVNPFSSKEYLQSLLGEIKILSHIGTHNSIVNMEGAFTKELTKGKVYVFMEFCGMGSLEKFLRLNKSKYKMENFDDELNLAKSDISIKHLLQYAHQIARGMEFLSSKKVLHGDLAARNILLVDENTAKISDFGLSRKLYGYVQYIKKKEEPLPWRWMAIESLREMNFSTASDVWMFGVLLYEIFSLGEVPYPGLSWSLDFVEKLENGFRMLKPKHAPVNIYKDVMLKCWEANPKDRPGFFDLSNYFYQMLQKITSKDYTELVENGEK